MTNKSISATSPVANIRFEDVCAAIHGETIATPESRKRTAYSVTLRVGYYDNNGDWKHRDTFTQKELLPAIEVLRKCYRIIEDKRDDY